MSRYSLNRRDRKIAGVCSTLGDVFNVDPTILRIGFVAAFFVVGWEVAVVAYVVVGIYLNLKKRRSLREDGQQTEFDRMAGSDKGRGSIHALRTQLDANDRRMMAIDHHLNAQNDELAREIEALRGEK